MKYLSLLAGTALACGPPATSKAPFPDPCGPLPPSGSDLFEPQSVSLAGRLRLTMVNTAAFDEPRRAHGTLVLEASDTLHRYYVQRRVYRDGLATTGWARVPTHAQSPWRGTTDIDLNAIAGTADYDSTWHAVEYRYGSLRIGMLPGMLDGGGTVLRPTHMSEKELFGRWVAYQGLAQHLDRHGRPITEDGYFCAFRSP